MRGLLTCVHVHQQLAGHFSSKREHKSSTGLVSSFALSFAIGFRVDQAAADCASASFHFSVLDMFNRRRYESSQNSVLSQFRSLRVPDA